MRWLGAALLALATTLSACGDDGGGARRLQATADASTSSSSFTSAAGDATTTTPPAPATPATVAKPQCVEEPLETYDYTNDPNGVAAQQNTLQADIDKVLAYGQQHPDEFTSVAFVNQPTVRIVLRMTRNLDRHRRAVRAQVENPGKVDVAEGVQSERAMQAMQEAVVKRAGKSVRSARGNAKGIVSVDRTQPPRVGAPRRSCSATSATKCVSAWPAIPTRRAPFPMPTPARRPMSLPQRLRASTSRSSSTPRVSHEVRRCGAWRASRTAAPSALSISAARRLSLRS